MFAFPPKHVHRLQLNVISHSLWLSYIVKQQVAKKRLLRLVSWMVYSMSLWLPSIYFPHRQYISLFCHFFPAISHQYRPIPTFFLGRPAANPAATQSVREGSQQPAAAAFPLHPRLHPHPTAPPVRLLCLPSASCQESAFCSSTKREGEGPA